MRLTSVTEKPTAVSPFIATFTCDDWRPGAPRQASDDPELVSRRETVETARQDLAAAIETVPAVVAVREQIAAAEATLAENANDRKAKKALRNATRRLEREAQQWASRSHERPGARNDSQRA